MGSINVAYTAGRTGSALADHVNDVVKGLADNRIKEAMVDRGDGLPNEQKHHGYDGKPDQVHGLINLALSDGKISARANDFARRVDNAVDLGADKRIGNALMDNSVNADDSKAAKAGLINGAVNAGTGARSTDFGHRLVDLASSQADNRIFNAMQGPKKGTAPTGATGSGRTWELPATGGAGLIYSAVESTTTDLGKNVDLLAKKDADLRILNALRDSGHAIQTDGNKADINKATNGLIYQALNSVKESIDNEELGSINQQAGIKLKTTVDGYSDGRITESVTKNGLLSAGTLGATDKSGLKDVMTNRIKFELQEKIGPHEGDRGGYINAHVEKVRSDDEKREATKIQSDITTHDDKLKADSTEKGRMNTHVNAWADARIKAAMGEIGLITKGVADNGGLPGFGLALKEDT